MAVLWTSDGKKSSNVKVSLVDPADGGGGGGTDAETVRDLIGSTLAEGDNITITVDDPGNTVTISALGQTGPTGPQGPAGATGATGPQGPAGADGQDGADGDRYASTSTTTLTVGSGTFTLTTGTGLAYSAAQAVLIAYDDDHHMHCLVHSYDPVTGLMEVTVDKHTGSGTYSSWTVNLDGAVGPAGPTGATGPSGVVTASSPITYDSGTQTVGIDQSLISIANTQVSGLATQTTVASPVAELDGTGLVLPGRIGNYASAPDSPALDITGNIELVSRIKLANWDRPANQPIIAKRTADTATHSYSLGIFSGLLRLTAATNGPAISAVATTKVPFTANQTGWVRATLTWGTPVGGYTVVLSYAADSPTEPTSWTTVGTVTATTAATALVPSNAPIEFGTERLGTVVTGAYALNTATVYRSIVRTGATTALDANFAAQPAGTLSFTESSPNGATVTVTQARRAADTQQIVRGDDDRLAPYIQNSFSSWGQFAFSDTDFVCESIRSSLITVGTMTAPRTMTLPDRAAIGVGQEIIVWSGNNVSATNTLTVQGKSGQTINGSSTYVIDRPRQLVRFICVYSSTFTTHTWAVKSGDVPDTRLVSSGTGLTGGGDLSADRTLSVLYGTTAGTAAEGHDSRLTDARTPTAHAVSHQDGGSDELALDASQVTTGVFPTSRMGRPLTATNSMMPVGGGGTPLFSNASASNTQAVAPGAMYLAPNDKSGLFVAIGFTVTVNTQGAGQGAYIVCYQAGSNGMPTTLLWSQFVTTGTGTGWFSVALTETVPTTCWLGVHNPSTNTGSVTYSGAFPVTGPITHTPTSGNSNRHAIVATSQGATPNTDVSAYTLGSPAATIFGMNANIPGLYVRVS